MSEILAGARLLVLCSLAAVVLTFTAAGIVNGLSYLLSPYPRVKAVVGWTIIAFMAVVAFAMLIGLCYLIGSDPTQP